MISMFGQMLTKNTIRNISYFFLIIFLSLIVYRVIMQMHSPHFEFLSQASLGVIQGKPHWITYQNRLLGPVIVLLISKIGFSYTKALKLFIFITILIENLALFVLLVKINTTYRKSLLWMVLFSSAFVGLQHNIFFYTWDSIDLIIFTFFSWGIFQSKSLYYFIVLFLIGILNKESALYISLYMMLDSFSLSFTQCRVSFQSKIKLVVGIILSFLGIIYTKLIRDYLFISRDNGLDDNAHKHFGQQIHFIQNLQDFFLNNIISINIINSLFIVLAVAYVVYSVRLYTDAQLKALMMFLIILASILVFGLINETRVYFILIPFLIFFKFSMDKPFEAMTVKGI